MTNLDLSKVQAEAEVIDPEAELAHAIEHQPFGPEEHKLVKDELGLRSVTDLTVMASDPFYCGTPGDWVQGEWFAELFERYNYNVENRAHNRRTHYVHFSMEGTRPPAKSKSKPPRTDWQYRNDDDDWTYLSVASKIARILDLVDPRAVVDHRNEPTRKHVRPRDEPAVPGTYWDSQLWRLPILNASTLLPTDLNFEIPQLEVYGYDFEYADRAVIPIVTFEKSTVDDIVDPICRELHMNYLSGAGYQSHTNIINLLLLMQEYEKDAVVLYGSDFDGAGAAMPVAMARTAQFYRHKFKIKQELYIQPITLSREQVEEYNLPQSPSKKGDKLVTELDALEALVPGELARIVRDAAAPYVTDELQEELAEAEREAITITEEAWQEALEDSWDEATEEQIEGPTSKLEAIENEALEVYEKYRERLGKIADELNKELKPLQKKLDDLREGVSGLSEEVQADLELPERPEADEPDIDRSSLMYDSERHWFDQLEAFKRWQQRHWSTDGAA